MSEKLNCNSKLEEYETKNDVTLDLDERQMNSLIAYVIS